LATNAAKYGALSADDGLVTVTWEVVEQHLDLKWQEERGPEVRPPIKKGFGSTLVENTISSYGGTINNAWSSNGLTVHIRIPMDRLSR
jgi:two-component sensor histidine kinase